MRTTAGAVFKWVGGVQVVTGQEFDDEEVDELLFSGQSDQIYAKAVEGGLRGQSVKEMLGQIEQRNDQMRKLEASMLDLQQIFMDMSVLVEEQAHQLDDIEQWVSLGPAPLRPARFPSARLPVGFCHRTHVCPFVGYCKASPMTACSVPKAAV